MENAHKTQKSAAYFPCELQEEKYKQGGHFFPNFLFSQSNSS